MNKLTKKTYLIYGLGVSYFMLDQIFVQWLNFFYLPDKNSGLTPLLTAKYLTIGYIIIRMIDALADPIVGYLSDHSNSRFGKRSVFLIMGGLPLSLSMILFFFPFTGNKIITLIYFIIVGSIFFISYTFVGGPYNALVADLSNSKEDRINLSTVQSVFRLIFSALPMILSGKLITMLSVGSEYSVEGFRKMAIIFSVLSLIGVYICAFFLEEKKYAKHDTNTNKVSFKETLKHIKTKEVTLYFLGFFCFFSGFNIIRTSLAYYVSAILNKDGGVASSLSTLLFIAAAVFFPVINKLTKKYGFKKIMILNLLTIILGVIGMIIFKNSNMWLIKASIFIIGAGISGAGFIFPPAMLSEIATKVSESTKMSVEGILFGIQGFFLKLAFMSQAIIVNNIIIYKAIPDASGFKYATAEGVIVTLISAIILFILSIVFYSIKEN